MADDKLVDEVERLRERCSRQVDVIATHSEEIERLRMEAEEWRGAAWALVAGYAPADSPAIIARARANYRDGLEIAKRVANAPGGVD